MKIYRAQTVPDASERSMTVEGPYKQVDIGGNTPKDRVSHRIQIAVGGVKVWVCVQEDTLEEVRHA